MVVKGLSQCVVNALDTIYGQLDNNPAFRIANEVRCSTRLRLSLIHI